MKLCIFILVVGGLFVEGTCHRVKRIVKGEDAEKGAWPWMVSIRMADDPEKHFCGGTLIGAEWVLTAFHCVPDVNLIWLTSFNNYEFRKPLSLSENNTVVIGDHTISENDGNEGVYTIIGAVIPPDAKDDIALLKLSRPVTFNKYRSIMPLPNGKKTSAAQPGKNCSIIGWGRDLRPSDYYSSVDTLQHVQIKIEPEWVCQIYNIFGWQYKPERDLCVGNAKFHKWATVCHGDSGGPLMCRDDDGTLELNGVTSRVLLCGAFTPSIFSRVSFYADFLHCVINGWEANCAQEQPQWVNTWQVYSTRSNGTINNIHQILPFD